VHSRVDTPETPPYVLGRYSYKPFVCNRTGVGYEPLSVPGDKLVDKENYQLVGKENYLFGFFQAIVWV
jgi:hypothetical protein